MPATTPTIEPHLPSRLASLVDQVRAATREAVRLARNRTRQGEGSYAECLGRFYDDAIALSHGRTRLIHIASAAETGALTLQHLQSGEAALGACGDRALHALFWATSRRWDGRRRGPPSLPGPG